MAVIRYSYTLQNGCRWRIGWKDADITNKYTIFVVLYVIAFTAFSSAFYFLQSFPRSV